MTDSRPLTVREHMVITLAETRFAGDAPGRKDELIRHQLGMSPARYYQVLNELLERPEALAHAPMTVRRLRRMRDRRREARRARRLGWGA